MAIGASLTRREQVMVGIAVAAVMVIAGYWYFFHSSRSSELDALEKRVSTLETANTRARADLAEGSVDRLRAEAARDARTLEIMQHLVPTSNEVPALLEDISTAARRVGLDIASVEPLPVLPGEDFDTYRYKLSVIGNYHAIGHFLSNVGSLPRIVAPVSLEIKRPVATATAAPVAGRRPPRTAPGKQKLETSFQVQTYVARVPARETAALDEAGGRTQ